MGKTFKPPSFKQLELAAELGISHLITQDVSSQEASRLIREALNHERRMKVLKWAKKREKNKSELLLN
jgi:hypothetical protein